MTFSLPILSIANAWFLVLKQSVAFKKRVRVHIIISVSFLNKNAIMTFSIAFLQILSIASALGY
jgi:hypothetical protein